MSTFVYAYVTKKKKTVLKLITEILTITEMTQTYIWFVP